jgi:hypothetical protein
VAQEDLARLVKPGIDLGAITNCWPNGLTAFTHSLDELLASMKEKRGGLLVTLADRKSGIAVPPHRATSPGLKE